MGQSGEIGQLITWVYTRDLPRSVHFYRDILGLPCIRDEGVARIFALRVGASIGVCEAFGDRSVDPAGSMITLVCDDVDGWYRKLVDAGAETMGAPHVLEKFNIYTFFIRDPDGYRIEIQKFLD